MQRFGDAAFRVGVRSWHKADIGRMSRVTLFGKLTHSLLGVTALHDQFSGDSGRLHRSLRDHFVFMSAKWAWTI
jgi:hypothetical protein